VGVDYVSVNEHNPLQRVALTFLFHVCYKHTSELATTQAYGWYGCVVIDAWLVYSRHL